MSGFGMSWLRSRLSDDCGAVLIIVAVWMTSAIAFVVFVVDVGHWFEHHRHLQMQVDAGALAGGGFFNGCVAASSVDRANSGSAANTSIANEARKYSGDTNTVPSALNGQVNNRS